MSESLRMEVKEFGIKVLTLAPGDYATDIASRRYHSPIFKKSPYKKYMESIEEINKHVEKGNPPEEIAKAIAKILTQKNPRVHYQVGPFLQKLSKTLKKFLPSRIFEKLIMNHYKL
jgi:short-subunit dehydrogenase